MATIQDYLVWRGDVPCTLCPYNEVDYYIIAKIGMPDFTGIVPENGEELSIGEAVRLWREANPDFSRVGLFGSKGVIPALLALPGTERFSGLRLSFYTQRNRPENNEQFSALTVTLPDGTKFVSFRGTDDYINAWREDCYLSFSDEVPAQASAAAYLNYVAAHTEGILIVGGHSKGGNLAVYSAANAPEEVQARIQTVYSYDGPGFRDGFFNTSGYRAIEGKVYSVIPQKSVVGQLLTPVPVTTVAACDKGLGGGHDGYNWEVTPTGFVPCDGISPSATRISEAFDQALSQKTNEERKEFIDEFFDTLCATGNETLSGLAEGDFRSALSLLKELRGDTEAMGFLKLVLTELVKENAERAKDGAADISAKLYRKVIGRKHEAG